MTSFSDEKTTALHRAIHQGKVDEAIHLLSDPEANINHVDYGDYRDCMTPFLRACGCRHPKIVRAFLDVSRRVDFGCGVLYHRQLGGPISKAIGDLETLNMLLDDQRIQVDMGQELRRALYHTHLPSIKTMLAHDRMQPSFLCGPHPHYEETLLATTKHGKYHKVGRLLRDCSANLEKMKNQLRCELGIHPGYRAGELFAIVVLLCDNYLELRE